MTRHSSSSSSPRGNIGHRSRRGTLPWVVAVVAVVLLAAVSSITTAAAFKPLYVSGSRVIVLSSEQDFVATVAAASLTLVEFYAPWCGHCKKLAPEYEAASLLLAESEAKAKAAAGVGVDDDDSGNDGVALTTVQLAKMDCTQSSTEHTCTRFGITSFPILRLFKRGDVDRHVTEYENARTRKALTAFMLEWASPVVTTLTSSTELQTFRQQHAMALVLFLSTTTSKSRAEAAMSVYTAVADEQRAVCAFGVVTNDDELKLAPTTTTRAPEQLLLFKQFDEPFVSFTPSSSTSAAASSTTATTAATSSSTSTPPSPLDVTVNDLRHLIGNHTFPLVSEIGPSNYRKFIDRGLPLVWTFVSPHAISQFASRRGLAGGGSDDDDNVLTQLLPVARKFRGELSVVYLNGHRWREHAASLGLSPGVLPSLAVESKRTKRNWPFVPTAGDGGNGFTAAAIHAFVMECQRKLHPGYTNAKPLEVGGGAKTTAHEHVHDEV